MYLRNNLEFVYQIKNATYIDMKKLIAAFLLIATAPSMAQQINLKSIFGDTKESITYRLPDTSINFDVEVNCITQTPGELYSYAEKYLNVKNCITKENRYWSIVGIKSSCEGIPNRNKAFTLKLSKAKGDITRNDKGIIESIVLYDKKKADGINSNPAEKLEEELDAAYQTSPRYTDPSLYLTEEILQATTTAKKAELIAREIYRIRTKKQEIILGEADNMPKDEPAISLILSELNKQEMALTEIFVGRTDTIYKKYSYTVTPEVNCDTTKAVLFRFSRKLGVLDKEDYAGEPIYYSMKDLKTVERTNTDTDKIAKEEISNGGLCYNTPGRLRLEVYSRTRRFLGKDLNIAQIGVTDVLPKDIFDSRKNMTTIIFDTTTGAILSISKE